MVRNSYCCKSHANIDLGKEMLLCMVIKTSCEAGKDRQRHIHQTSGCLILAPVIMFCAVGNSAANTEQHQELISSNVIFVFVRLILTKKRVSKASCW